MSAPLLAAAVQATPVFLDRDRTVDKVVALIAQAGNRGAALVAFPEAFVPGYPDWVWRAPAWSDLAYAQALTDQAVDLASPATARIGEAARAAHAWVTVGVTERGSPAGPSTTRCSTSLPTERWPDCTANSWQPGANAPCGPRRRVHPSAQSAHFTDGHHPRSIAPAVGGAAV